MERLNQLVPRIVDEMPQQKEHGILYISEKYNIAIHLCACGCGIESVTPIKNNEWTLTNNGDKYTLRPSIGNFSGETNYHAHYFITENRIDWC